MKISDLIVLIKNDFDKAYRMLYQQYYGMIKHLIFSNNGVEADVDDIFQETIISLYENVMNHDFVLKGSLKNYIYSIARYKWIAELKRNTRTINFNDCEKAIDENNFIDVAEEDKTYKNEELVKMVFSKLSETCKEILKSFYFFKLSMQEIAENMGYTNAENAKNQKYKCMNKVKVLLKDRKHVV